jgi:hypothetical protein
MPLVEFEPTVPVFERVKAFLALDRAATVTCYSLTTFYINFLQFLVLLLLTFLLLHAWFRQHPVPVSKKTSLLNFFILIVCILLREL